MLKRQYRRFNIRELFDESVSLAAYFVIVSCNFRISFSVRKTFSRENRSSSMPKKSN